ncbi:MAG: FecR domain-containing protein [Bacteroidales bacterium]|nr:FecR domain-containing protein [Bacteroidales bacterium]
MERSKLYQYFAGKLDPQGIGEIKSWAEESEENMKTLLRERKLYDAIVLLDKTGMPSEKKRRHRFFSSRSFYPRAVAFLLVALLSGGAALFLSGLRENRGDRARETITVPAGERVNLLLADGTNVWLNASTTMSYYPDMRGRKREIFLDGQAYFDVAKDKKRPFIVHTFALDVQAHGTQFDVCAYSKRGVFETALMNGSISAYPEDEPGRRVYLRPNQKILLQDGVYKTTRIDDMGFYRWKEGIYCFKDKNLSALFEDLERYYDCVFCYEPDPVLEKETITGKLRISDGIDQALSVLQHSLRFSYLKERDSNLIHISTKQ